MKKNGTHFLVFLAFTVSSILLFVAPIQAAEKPIELRLAHLYPVGPFRIRL